MSELIEEPAIEETLEEVDPTPTPAPAAAEPPKAETSTKEEKALTKYYVLAGPEEKGPYDLIGQVEASGQTAAKKAGVLAVNKKSGDANEKFFLAIPASSWIPQKPSVEVVTTVGFD